MKAFLRTTVILICVSTGIISAIEEKEYKREKGHLPEKQQPETEKVAPVEKHKTDVPAQRKIDVETAIKLEILPEATPTPIRREIIPVIEQRVKYEALPGPQQATRRGFKYSTEEEALKTNKALDELEKLSEGFRKAEEEAAKAAAEQEAARKKEEEKKAVEEETKKKTLKEKAAKEAAEKEAAEKRIALEKALGEESYVVDVREDTEAEKNAKNIKASELSSKKLSDEIRKKQAEITELSEQPKTKDLTKKISDLEKEVSELQMSLKEENNKLTNLKRVGFELAGKEKEEKKKEIEKTGFYTKALNEANNKIDDLKRKKAEIKSKIESIESEESVYGKVKRFGSENQKLEARIKNYDSYIKFLKDDNLEELEKKIESARKSNQDIISNTESAIKRGDETAATKRIDELKSSQKELEETMEKINALKKAKSENNQEEIEKLTTELENLFNNTLKIDRDRKKDNDAFITKATKDETQKKEMEADGKKIAAFKKDLNALEEGINKLQENEESYIKEAFEIKKTLDTRDTLDIQKDLKDARKKLKAEKDSIRKKFLDGTIKMYAAELKKRKK